MLRRIVCILSAAGVLLVFSVPVLGAEITGTIRIVPDWVGNRVMGGEVALYRIGDPVAGGYRVSDGLASWTVWKQEIFTESFLQWALMQSKEPEKTYRITDEQGAVFTELEEGLYLVTQKEAAAGFSAFSPVFVTLPMDERMEVTVNPEVIALTQSPQTGDHPAPIFSAMFLSLCAVVVMLLVENRKK